jgi:phenylpyruvate tautomerase PptA (4-oxalocrotonate tautomerase family)
MPTHVCSAAAGRLTSDQKAEIARSITATHHEVTGAPRYLVQVIFHDVALCSHYIAGRSAPADQIWVRADIRNGRTDEQKSQMLHRMLGENNLFHLGANGLEPITMVLVEIRRGRSLDRRLELLGASSTSVARCWASPRGRCSSNLPFIAATRSCEMVNGPATGPPRKAPRKGRLRSYNLRRTTETNGLP